ncbi:DMT family transporter [Tersicoccus sp. MR15.9]|uniref:DMT family transporter n=1 Tax=Tersicoccus mangrovi TaxID=3121635 RepID=UPI002FE58E3B
MTVQSSATHRTRPVLSAASVGRSGWWWGLLGTTAFSFTVPFTRVAVASFPALFIGSARGVIAAVLAGIVLTATRQRFPTPRQWVRLAVVAAGVVAGFPLLTSFALTTAPAGHSAVVIGLLPAATAVAAVIRGRERPTRSFWVLAALGAVVTVVVASLQNGGLGSLHWSDLLLLGAVVAAAVGYAEGGLLSRELGSWQTISWALVVAAPLTTLCCVLSIAGRDPTGTPTAWLALGYLGVVSMFLGFFAWYRGLAIGPMAQVSQVQLVQPVLTLLWAALLLHEQIGWPTVVGGLAVIACAALAVRTRLSRKETS